MERILFNTKPSNRIIDRFKKAFPEASFVGREFRSKVTTFSIPLEVYNARKEELKMYGSKARTVK